MLKPSHFCEFPFSSVLQNTESEIIAVNIMKIRRRLGDEWELSWEKYRDERLKDKGFTEREKWYFDKVMPLIPDAIGAIAFSPEWQKSAREEKENI